MKLMIAQINSTVGDLAGNLRIIKQNILLASQSKCDVVVFPELATTGYPPRDLLYSKKFWADHDAVIDNLVEFISQHKQITVFVGGLDQEVLADGRYARYNAAWVLDKHYGRRVVHKTLLPCYDVFDETRYFLPNEDEHNSRVSIRVLRDHPTSPRYCDVECDVLICEDIWNNQHRSDNEEWMKPATYLKDPLDSVDNHSANGPLIVLNASPFWIGKIEETQELIEGIVTRIDRPVVWCNQIGAHDDIVTGGYSMVSIPFAVDVQGRAKSATRIASPFQEDQIVVSLDDECTPHSNLSVIWSKATSVRKEPVSLLDQAELWGNKIEARDFEMWSVYKALYLHMYDYKRRCGFKKGIIGLSGGIDSAVVAAIAADVFQNDVICVGMPSPYSSEASLLDAKSLADNLKIAFDVKDITEIYEQVKNLFLSGGQQQFANPVTDENIQPRVRAMLLMAYCNEYNALLLTTGNKSELTVGYCTINGDMCGGLAVLSDIWKTDVYRLARFINRYRDNVIPQNTINRPASAELKPNQEDTDSLPPYNVLDPMLQMMVEREMTPEEILADGSIMANHSEFFAKIKSPLQLIRDIYQMYSRSEYKRQQLAPGPKLHRCGAYGSGRRKPIAAKITSL